MKGFVKLMSVKKNSENVCKYVALFAGHDRTPPALKDEYAMIVDALQNKTVNLARLDHIKNRFESETGLEVQKSMVGLPTGDEILTALDTAINQRTNDNGCVTVVTGVVANLKMLQPITEDRCKTKGGGFVLPDHQTFKKCQKEYLVAISKCSPMLKVDHADIVNEALGLFNAALTTLNTASDGNFFTAMNTLQASIAKVVVKGDAAPFMAELQADFDSYRISPRARQR